MCRTKHWWVCAMCVRVSNLNWVSRRVVQGRRRDATRCQLYDLHTKSHDTAGQVDLWSTHCNALPEPNEEDSDNYWGKPEVR